MRQFVVFNFRPVLTIFTKVHGTRHIIILVLLPFHPSCYQPNYILPVKNDVVQVYNFGKLAPIFKSDIWVGALNRFQCLVSKLGKELYALR
jgi:hypothetical protein